MSMGQAWTAIIPFSEVHVHGPQVNRSWSTQQMDLRADGCSQAGEQQEQQMDRKHGHGVWARGAMRAVDAPSSSLSSRLLFAAAPGTSWREAH